MSENTNELKEQPISKAIQDYLDKRGIYNDRLNSGRVKASGGKWIQLAKIGSPDRWFLLPGGRLGMVEVKKKGGKLSPEQVERHEMLRRAGAVILTADSIDSFITQFEGVLSA